MEKRSFKRLFKEAKESETYWTATITLEFTEKLYRLMEANSISRAELARRLGVSPAYVTKALRGNINFTVASMVRLARAAGGMVFVGIEPSAEDKAFDMREKSENEFSTAYASWSDSVGSSGMPASWPKEGFKIMKTQPYKEVTSASFRAVAA